MQSLHTRCQKSFIKNSFIRGPLRIITACARGMVNWIELDEHYHNKVLSYYKCVVFPRREDGAVASCSFINSPLIRFENAKDRQSLTEHIELQFVVALPKQLRITRLHRPSIAAANYDGSVHPQRARHWESHVATLVWIRSATRALTGDRSARSRLGYKQQWRSVSF